MDFNSPLANHLLPFYEEQVDTHCQRQTPLTKAVLILMLLGVTNYKTVTTILIQSGYKKELDERKPCWLRKLQHKHKSTIQNLRQSMREAK
jgi:hypothetical protein